MPKEHMLKNTKREPQRTPKELRDMLCEAYILMRRAESCYDLMDAIDVAPESEVTHISAQYLTLFLEQNPEVSKQIHLADPIVDKHPNETNFTSFTSNILEDATNMRVINLFEKARKSASGDARKRLDDFKDNLLHNPRKVTNHPLEVQLMGLAEHVKDHIPLQDFTSSLSATLNSKDDAEKGKVSADTAKLAGDYNVARASTLVTDFLDTLRQQQDNFKPKVVKLFIETPTAISLGEKDSLTTFRNDVVHGNYNGNLETNTVYKLWESNHKNAENSPISEQILQKYVFPFCSKTGQAHPPKLDINRTLRSWLKHYVANELAPEGAGSTTVGQIESSLNDKSFNQRTKAWKDVLHQLRGSRHKLSTSSDKHYADFTNHFTMAMRDSALVNEDTKKHAVATSHENMPFTKSEIAANTAYLSGQKSPLIVG